MYRCTQTVLPLCLQEQGTSVYQFQILPFGLSTVPQVFTRLGHSVAGYFSRQRLSVLSYLDDW